MVRTVTRGGHGTSGGWHSGCRCLLCRQAHNETQRAFGRARAQQRHRHDPTNLDTPPTRVSGANLVKEDRPAEDEPTYANVVRLAEARRRAMRRSGIAREVMRRGSLTAHAGGELADSSPR